MVNPWNRCRRRQGRKRERRSARRRRRRMEQIGQTIMKFWNTSGIRRFRKSQLFRWKTEYPAEN